jgi:hypothetical protein
VDDVFCFSDPPDRMTAFGSVRMTIYDGRRISRSLLVPDDVFCFSDPPDRKAAFGSARMTIDYDDAASADHHSSGTTCSASAIRPTARQRSAWFA